MQRTGYPAKYSYRIIGIFSLAILHMLFHLKTLVEQKSKQENIVLLVLRFLLVDIDIDIALLRLPPKAHLHYIYSILCLTRDALIVDLIDGAS